MPQRPPSDRGPSSVDPLRRPLDAIRQWVRMSGPVGPADAAGALDGLAPADEAPPWPPRDRLRRAMEFVRPDRSVVAMVLLLTLTLAAIGAVEPLILKFIFDELTAGADVGPLALGVGLLIGVGLAREGLGGVSNWLTWRVRLRVHQRLQEATVGRLHTLPLTFHRQQTVGGMMTRLDRGIQGYLSAFTEVAFSILPALAYLAMAIVVMAGLDWRLTLVVLAFAPGPALIGAWAAREQTKREKTLLDKWTNIYSRFNEVLAGILVVKSFAMEDAEKRRFLRDVGDANQVVIRGVARDSTTAGFRNLIAAFARVAVIAFGGYLVLQGQVTIGTLIAFLGYIGGIFGPVQGLTGTYQTFRRAAVSLDVIFSILDAQDSLGDKPDAIELGPVRGEVHFDAVSFSYSPTQAILRQVDLHVPPGETIAIVGPSGSGKTTLMALLQRLYDPTTGRILVDGMDLRDIKQRSLRKQIGVVLQDAVLFNDTIRNIIAYGRPEASDAEIEEAAKSANAHEFIMRLPEAYDTMAGERGARFSGGERQRIAIARALLKDPPILVLDEATSALDAESEALVQEALERLMTGRTTFIIAHRLATVVSADRIVVLRDGNILELGTHAQLLGRGGYYASLVRQQTKGLLWPAGTPVVQ